MRCPSRSPATAIPSGFVLDLVLRLKGRLSNSQAPEREVDPRTRDNVTGRSIEGGIQDVGILLPEVQIDKAFGVASLRLKSMPRVTRGQGRCPLTPWAPDESTVKYFMSY